MLEKLYRDNFDMYVSLMSRYLGGDRDSAEDVVQEAFVRAFKYKEGYDENLSSVKTWFNKILFNALNDHKKDSGFGKSGPLRDLSSEDFRLDLPDKPPDGGDEAIKKAIKLVRNPLHQRVLYLFFVLGYTSSEISQMEDVNVSNITTIANRFKRGVKND